MKNEVQSCLRNLPPNSQELGVFCLFASTAATAGGRCFCRDFNLSSMPDSSYPFRPAKVYKGKRLYVQFYIWSIPEQKLLKKRYYRFEGSTEKQRIKDAEKKARIINRMLAKGGVITGRKSQPQNKEDKSDAKPQTFLHGIRHAAKLKMATTGNRSRQAYTSMQNLMADWAAVSDDAAIHLAQIEPKHVQGFFSWMKEPVRIVGGKKKGPISNRTYNNRIIMMRALFAVLVDEGLMERNPAKKIRKLNQESGKNLPYPDGLADAFSEYLSKKDPILHLFTRFIYYAFLRPAEIVKLKAGHLDLENGIIRLDASIAKNRRQSSKAIPGPLMQLIKKAGLDKIPGHWYIFGSGMQAAPTHTHRNLATKRHRQAQENFGCYGLGYTMYSWRHTSVCKLVRDKGYTAVEIKDLLDHSDLQTTYNYLRSLGLAVNKRIKNTDW